MIVSIPISQIIPPTPIDKIYAGFVESIRTHGIIRPLYVRERDSLYEIIDGRHRYFAAIDAGLHTVPVEVVTMADEQLIEYSLMASVHCVPTKPIEYAKQLKKILEANSQLTIKQFASKLGKSAYWVKQKLDLLKLSKEAQFLLDAGMLTLAQAKYLSNLIPENQNKEITNVLSGVCK